MQALLELNLVSFVYYNCELFDLHNSGSFEITNYLNIW